mgnify:CR=1 FL=1
MEEKWQRFTATGRVQDYLSYCTAKSDDAENREQMKWMGEEKNGTNGNPAWNGDSQHSHGRI